MKLVLPQVLPPPDPTGNPNWRKLEVRIMEDANILTGKQPAHRSSRALGVPSKRGDACRMPEHTHRILIEAGAPAGAARPAGGRKRPQRKPRRGSPRVSEDARRMPEHPHRILLVDQISLMLQQAAEVREEQVRAMQARLSGEGYQIDSDRLAQLIMEAIADNQEQYRAAA